MLTVAILLWSPVTGPGVSDGFAQNRGEGNDAGQQVNSNNALNGAFLKEGALKAEDLARSDDDRRPEDQLRTLFIGRPLTIGGEYGFTFSHRNNFALHEHAEDDITKIDMDLEIELLYDVADETALFLEIKPFYDSELYREAGHPNRDEKGIKRGEMWLYMKNIRGSNIGLQIGRQSFEERQGWWWDEDLDAVRLYYRAGKFRFQAGLARELAKTSTDEDDIDPEDEDIYRIISQAAWRWSKDNRGEIFFLHAADNSMTESVGDVLGEDERDESDADLTWVGLRYRGKSPLNSYGRLYYRVDAAALWGEERIIDYKTVRSDRRKKTVDKTVETDVSGWAVDAVLTWKTDAPGKPAVTVGYAVGSGDPDLDDNKDRSFRQTGLHDNDGRFRGVNSFRYYGELLRPELSNMHILTAALGIPLFESSSIELVYHRYWQYHAAPFLRDARLRADPLGEDNEIGQEWDLVIGIEEWKHVELEFVGAYFIAGDAFGVLSGDDASYFAFKFTYNF